MVIVSLFLLLPMLTSAHGETNPSSEDKKKWAIREVSRRENPTLPPPYLHLPVFVDSQMLVDKEHFSPARGTGQETLPEQVREILLPLLNTITIGPPTDSGVPVKVSCREKTMVVRVHRSILGSGPHLHVKLGTCHANEYSKDYLYFEYDIGMCGTKRTVTNNQVVYINTLKYDVPKIQGPIRRAVSFTMSVACYFNRYLYTYKIGYTPKMEIQKVFKPLKNVVQFILTPLNAQWERLSPPGQYVLGMPMYFQAEASPISQNERLYIHLCYATPEKSYSSSPQFPVVNNSGCMVESKDNHSRFILYKNNIVRFSVDAFLFKGISHKRLYMHCSMSVDYSTPTPTAKSCNYDSHTGRWVELHGSESVCTCCDSICISSASTVAEMISSKSLTVKSEVKFISPKRTTISTTISSTTTTVQPQSTKKKTPWRTILQPTGTLEAIVDKLDNMVTTLEWPENGEATMIKEVEQAEMNVKEITMPRTIFEDIFVFDQ
ncbi:zona pellucida sperm-binding protein 3d.2 [Takifugu rubripes]|uniref:Zona pellucida sperm-binding protein 3 n=1 Tax=Takifugu rubripes TaxID=31033 RepID=A0A3B5KNN5_TAKRU|nr:zona pellucida sperm-binding protein 3-like [Takifugu rubripes]|eukprot:XP_003977163.2 PREDICTED: zona pellucida sperm-binding protein 3-like [Takifugu rubripes]